MTFNEKKVNTQLVGIPKAQEGFMIYRIQRGAEPEYLAKDQRVPVSNFYSHHKILCVTLNQAYTLSLIPSKCFDDIMKEKLGCCSDLLGSGQGKNDDLDFNCVLIDFNYLFLYTCCYPPPPSALVKNGIKPTNKQTNKHINKH